MNALLRTEKLNRAFGSLVVTSDVDLEILPGERHALIGPNGAGKTSFVNQLGGQLQPSSGRILFKGEDIAGLAPEAICRRGIARTFQKNNLFRGLSVRENVRLAVQAHRGNIYQALRSIQADRGLWERADELLASVGLHGDAERKVSELSYGEQRQLEIAIALASEPELLLLDEPTSGMSPSETDGMIALVRGLPKSLALLMIEHDMKVVFSLADRITVLYYGAVLASGTPTEIQASARVREVYLGEAH
ncbi:ABC transporter ATP-binding protein [Ramlibacter sp.]|uniref:ABC transporter ATP-binding protein n=1 Tax=Ramlibacter sp. TaxID=1917967 RepID=UPI003D10FFB4